MLLLCMMVLMNKPIVEAPMIIIKYIVPTNIVDGTVECNICDETFKTAYHLEYHVNSSHVRSSKAALTDNLNIFF